MLFVPTIAYSLTKMPYRQDLRPPDGRRRRRPGTSGPGAHTVHGPAGELVEIRVTGADVNHGFGVYDANDRLITQTQAMPGFTNVIRHTFATPGTYRIRCLEYCGLGHHTMISQLIVTPAR